MIKHRAFSVMLVLLAAVVLACRPPAKEQLSDSVKRDLASLSKEKALIEDKLRDMERSRSLLEQRTRDELETMRRSIESIQNALNSIQARLEAMEAVPPTKPVQPKRLPLAISVTLAVTVIFCVLFAWKLRRMRTRAKSQPPTQEVTGNSGAGSSQT